jgi:hypothetical protein
MKFNIERIRAQKILERGHHTNFIRSTLEKLEDAMETGNFKESLCSAITISTSGKVLNGKHVLKAIVLTDKEYSLECELVREDKKGNLEIISWGNAKPWEITKKYELEPGEAEELRKIYYGK